MGRFKVVDGVKVDFTPEEETARDAEEKVFAEEQVELTRTRYKRQRKREYPTIGDQLDSLYHSGVFSADMTKQIKAIKDKFPKEQ